MYWAINLRIKNTSWKENPTVIARNVSIFVVLKVGELGKFRSKILTLMK